MAFGELTNQTEVNTRDLFPGSNAFVPELANQLYSYIQKIIAMDNIMAKAKNNTVRANAEEARDTFTHTMLVILKAQIVDENKLEDKHDHQYKHHPEVAELQALARQNPTSIPYLPLLALSDYQSSKMTKEEYSKYKIPKEINKKLKKLRNK